MKTLERHIKDSWDEQYRTYDFKQLPWETVEPDKELVRILKEKLIKKCKVLDIGCGAGTNSIFLAKNGFDVTGIDISPHAISTAIERAKEAGVKIKFSVENAFNLKFAKGSFDFIFDRGCFHHIPIEFRNHYVKQNYKLLTDKGRYYMHAFSDSNNWHQENLFSLGKIKSYFGSHFKIIDAREIGHDTRNGEKVYLRSVFMEKI